LTPDQWTTLMAASEATVNAATVTGIQIALRHGPVYALQCTFHTATTNNFDVEWVLDANGGLHTYQPRTTANPAHAAIAAGTPTYLGQACVGMMKSSYAGSDAFFNVAHFTTKVLPLYNGVTTTTVEAARALSTCNFHLRSYVVSKFATNAYRGAKITSIRMFSYGGGGNAHHGLQGPEISLKLKGTYPAAAHANGAGVWLAHLAGMPIEAYVHIHLTSFSSMTSSGHWSVVNAKNDDGEKTPLPNETASPNVLIAACKAIYANNGEWVKQSNWPYNGAAFNVGNGGHPLPPPAPAAPATTFKSTRQQQRKHAAALQP